MEQLRESGGGKALDYLGKVVRRDLALRQPLTAYCYRHKGHCKLVPTKVHCAGSPCTDFTPLGEQEGDEGITAVDLLAWIAKVRHLQYPTVVFENVRAKRLLEILASFLQDSYYMDAADACPMQFGWATRRQRMFVVFRHRVKTRPMISSLDKWLLQFHRRATFTWRDYFQSTPQQYHDEKVWALHRPQTKEKLKARLDAGEPLENFTHKDCLNNTELDIVEAYQCSSCPGCVFSLNQDPRTDHGRLSSQTTLHTVVKNFGIAWSDEMGMWMTGDDALVANGFVTAPEEGQKPTCCFAIPPPDWTRLHRYQMAGNTMHVNVIGLVVMAAFVCKESGLNNSMNDGNDDDDDCDPLAVFAERARHRHNQRQHE